MLILCISFCVYINVYVYVYLVVFVFFFFLCSFLLQYFDTVGWVFSPVKTVSRITYTVLEGTSNTAHSLTHSLLDLLIELNGKMNILFVKCCIMRASVS